MEKFEFVVVLLSIIFGLGMANLLSGMVRAFFLNELTNVRLAWSLAAGLAVLINWWGLFRWSEHAPWLFIEYLYLTLWATAHYLLAVSLYPYDFLESYTEDLRRKFFLGVFMTAIVIDIGEALYRGEFFQPWYFPLLYLALMALLMLSWFVPRPKVLSMAGWTFFTLILFFAVIVRSILGT